MARKRVKIQEGKALADIPRGDRLRLSELLSAAADNSNARGCWVTKQRGDARGYPFFWIGGKSLRASRAAYVFTVGPLADGDTVDHVCENPACVNPAHLRKLGHAVNASRALNPSRTDDAGADPEPMDDDASDVPF